MEYKLIKNVKTRIRHKRQLVIIEFNSDKEFVFLLANNIKQNTKLEANEIELIVGSTLRIDFYKNGETMFNGKLCTKENLIVKEYYFNLIKPVEKLRLENSNQLLPFKKIKEIFYFNKFSRENVGIKSEDGQITYITLDRFEKQSGLHKSEQHILIGSFIYPEYFKAGEKFSDGTVVSQNNKVLKWINMRYSDRLDAMHETYENSLGYYNGEEGSLSSENGARAFGYDSWVDMAINEAFEGDKDAWNAYRQ